MGINTDPLRKTTSNNEQLLLTAKIPFDPSRWPFHYGWFILLAGTLGTVMAAPGQTIGVSAFIEPLMADTGLSRSAISSVYGISTLISAMLLTFGGRLYDRIGARKSAALAGLILGFTLISLSNLETFVAALSTRIPQMTTQTSVFAVLLPGFLLLRFSGQGMLTMVSSNMVMKWFVYRRGLASGVMGVFVGLIHSFSPRVFNAMINAYSWQTTWKVIGVLSAVVFVAFVLIFYRDNPADCGLEPDAGHKEHPDAPQRKPARNLCLRDAFRTWPLWIFTISLSLHSFYNTAFSFHIESIMAHIGYGATAAYGIFLPIAVIAVTLGLVAGWISDHIPINRLLALLLAGLAVSMIGLLINMHRVSYVMIILGNGLTNGMFGVLMSITWPYFFGNKHLGEINGFNMTANVLFSAISPAFFAVSVRLTDEYRPAIFCCLIAVSFLALLIPKAENPQSSSNR